METGGDLFGLWSTDNAAVVHLVLGPGEHSRRTTTSFFQNTEYLGNKRRQLTQEYGLCHIGEWHSHHTLGLARPSAGDESTVWRHMPSNGFRRFIVCIANIDRAESSRSHAYLGRENCVGLGCFLFEVKDTVTWDRDDMLQDSFEVLEVQSSYRNSRALQQTISIGAKHVHSLNEVNVKEQFSVSRGYAIQRRGSTYFYIANYNPLHSIMVMAPRSSLDLTSVSKSGSAPPEKLNFTWR